MPSGVAPPAGLAALAEQARGMGGRCFLIAAEPKDAPAGFEPLADPDDKVAVRYGTRARHGSSSSLPISMWPPSAWRPAWPRQRWSASPRGAATPPTTRRS